MADFFQAKPYVLHNEGGYVNDIHDIGGGETYCGISRKNFPNWDGWATVDKEQRKYKGWITPALDASVDAFYKKQVWDSIRGDSWNLQPLATYFFDWHTTSGGAVKQLQKLLGITADGIFGSGTLSAVNAAGDFLDRLHKCRCDYYISLNNDRFEKGWLNRANSMYEEMKKAAD